VDENVTNEIMDRLTKVCLCKSIPRSTIKKAIKNGARTLENIQKATGAGPGGCKGNRCTPKIEEILKQKLQEDK